MSKFIMRSPPTPPNKNHFIPEQAFLLEDNQTLQSLIDIVGNNISTAYIDIDRGDGDYRDTVSLCWYDEKQAEEDYKKAIDKYNEELKKYKEWYQKNEELIKQRQEKEKLKKNVKVQKEIDRLEKQLKKLKKEI